jgi:DNA ligase-1
MMRDFARLYQRLDETTKTSDKVSAIVQYFADSPKADAAYALYFLLGHKLKPTLPTRIIRLAAARSAQIPDWLFEETYQWVGDLAETAATMARGVSSGNPESLSQTVEQSLIPLLQLAGPSKRKSRTSASQKDAKATDDDRLASALIETWSRYDSTERFVFNKLLTGNLRVGVSAKLVTKALGHWCGLPTDELTHRLMGQWEPNEAFLSALIAQDSSEASPSKPYPFCLAHGLPEGFSQCHSVSDYIAEWKWDGIRAQLIQRSGHTFLWSRGEELLDGRFPEIQQAAAGLPDGLVLDGEILAFGDNRPLPFTLLQRRIQRKKPTAKILAEIPVVFVAFDLLEHNNKDLRNESFQHRREILESLKLGNDPAARSLRCNEMFLFDHWDQMIQQRDQARAFGAEGLMLKHRTSLYQVGRVTGTWWKSKVTPYTIDAVLVYAQRGHGRRAGLFSDYTFALWDQDRLVPFAKAYSGLTNEEIGRLDRWIKENTTQRFGPVHEVPPRIVMELAFENIQESSRHKSGIAVRFPRILRWRDDKSPQDADRLDQIKQMLQKAQPR